MWSVQHVINVNVLSLSSPPEIMGIIGRPLSDYEPGSLKYIDQSDESEIESDEEEGDSDTTEQTYSEHHIIGGEVMDIDEDDTSDV